jgi:hypothetical protein
LLVLTRAKKKKNIYIYIYITLAQLTRLGGSRVTMSPSLDYVAECSDVIEAIPLFIYEREVSDGAGHRTVFEVDQDGLEVAIRGLAVPWGENIARCMLSEHVALAREIVASGESALVDAEQTADEVAIDDACRVALMAAAVDDAAERRIRGTVGAVARWIDAAVATREGALAVETIVQECWLAGNHVSRLQAVRAFVALGGSAAGTMRTVVGDYTDPAGPWAGPMPSEPAQRVLAVAAEADSTAPNDAAAVVPRATTSDAAWPENDAFTPRRPVPALHMLTTEAPGLVEGFVQVVLEDEIALQNVCKYSGAVDGNGCVFCCCCCW